MIRKYREASTAVVEAIQHDGTNGAEIVDWAGPDRIDVRQGWIVVRGPEGPLLIWRGYWIVKDARGQILVFRPETFAEAYEPFE
jgi:hypothetical protein